MRSPVFVICPFAAKISHTSLQELQVLVVLPGLHAALAIGIIAPGIGTVRAIDSETFRTIALTQAVPLQQSFKAASMPLSCVSVCKVSSTPPPPGGRGAVGLERCQVRAQGSNVRFAD